MSVEPETTDRYALETHTNLRPTPIAIWEMKDGKAGRCVANLKTDAQPTLEEACAMVTALNKMPRGQWCTVNGLDVWVPEEGLHGGARHG